MAISLEEGFPEKKVKEIAECTFSRGPGSPRFFDRRWSYPWTGNSGCHRPLGSSSEREMRVLAGLASV